MKCYIKRGGYYLVGLFPIKFSLISHDSELHRIAYWYREPLIAAAIAEKLDALVEIQRGD